VTLVLPNAEAEGEENLAVRSPTEEQCSLLKIHSDLQPYDSFASYATRLSIKGIPREEVELYGPDLGHAVAQYTELAVAMTNDLHPDVLHCHDWMTYEAGTRAARHHRRPLVAHIHATELDRTDFHPNEWIYGRERTGLMAADKIIAVSNYTKNILTQHYGISPSKITVVHNGHDAKRGRTIEMHNRHHGNHHKHHPLVLFLGRLTMQKNPWQFLETARRVRDFRHDVQFVMAGDGPMLPQLIERSCALGLSQCMIFAGKVHNREVDRLYSQADCFVMPSLSEPFGLVALEAISHGTPVIVSKQSGVAEVLDHAFKVDFWDTEKMADCILTILREQPLAEQLRSEAPRILQRLTWQNQANHVRAIYHQLLSNQ
jgi:glycosyltransferase involved in cell wall biosynthesis